VQRVIARPRSIRPRAKICGPVNANFLKNSIAALMKSQGKIVMVYRMSIQALIFQYSPIDNSIFK
jgi:hypothetical protein